MTHHAMMTETARLLGGKGFPKIMMSKPQLEFSSAMQ